MFPERGRRIRAVLLWGVLGAVAAFLLATIVTLLLATVPAVEVRPETEFEEQTVNVSVTVDLEEWALAAATAIGFVLGSLYGARRGRERAP